MGKRTQALSKLGEKQAPAMTPFGREQQMARLAYDAIEQRIRDGRASAQELVFFAKAGSPAAQLEYQILEEQHKLVKAKTERIQSEQRTEELYANAMRAFRTYAGEAGPEDEDDEEY